MSGKDAQGVPQRPWLTVTEAGRDYLGINEAAVRAAIRAGDLPAYETPRSAARAEAKTRRYLVNINDLDAWVRTWPRAPLSALAS